MEKQIIGGLAETQFNRQEGGLDSILNIESIDKKTTAQPQTNNMTANQKAPKNIIDAQFYGRLDLTRQEVDAAEDLDKLITK